MAIVMRHVCDVHYDDDEHPALGSVRIAISGDMIPSADAGPYIVDVCATAFDEHIKPLLALLTVQGREDDDAIRDSGLQCPQCGKVYKNRKRYLTHVDGHDDATTNGTKPKPKAKRTSTTAPDGSGKVYPCRVDGCESAFHGRYGAQGRAGHEWTVHKFRAPKAA